MRRGPKPYDLLLRHGLTRLDAEAAHHRALDGLRAGGAFLRRVPVPATHEVRAMGLVFANPLGLAAGFDKSARGFEQLGGFGFGHVEVGTVTALAQPGNPRPRLFRLPQDRAIVNRMGFNNDGAAAVAQRLARRRRRSDGPVLGVNIGKSKVVPDDDQAAVEADYETSTRLLAPYADYLVVNVSSPNTPGLRNLQAVERLAPLLAHVRRIADQATEATDVPGRRAGRVPLLVKIAPDLADADVSAVADLALDQGLAGIIATNTTTDRDGLRSAAAEVAAVGAGGLSGAPLHDRAIEVVSMLRARVGSSLTLIGVGGITTPEQASARLAAGADLVQVYTGLVYGGPLWPRRVLRGLS